MKAQVKRTKQSKVCTIANKLVKEGYSRSAAFIRAWILVKLQQVKIRVAGVTYGLRQKALEHLRRYNPQMISISLERENDNAADTNAVKVIATVEGKGSYCMGYLPRGTAQLIAPLLDCGQAVTALYSQVRVRDKSLPYGLEIAVRA